MEKMFFILLVLLLATSKIQAQTFAEWFSQKKTQKKYLIEQIAALKIYGGYLKKGYDIGKKGLGTISQIKNGEFNLHRDFFGSLSTVNPAIKKDPRVADIEQMQYTILELKNQVFRNVSSADLVSKKEKQYIRDVFDRLLENCNHLLEDLGDVALSARLTMKDDQRLVRIEKIHREMEDNYWFANYFSNQLKALISSRRQGLREADHSNLIFGIK
ncbi:hypothetical protein [Sphingobacterium detergens]|uniref:TerB family tellurite resistance protein n=1 Tax=Sphingobacterium detergens TaxID=1145106 RepID=A0A420ARY7_SPHD1|nr:hypothetical protein [Sphingobacterium detergens]RKE47177.1 hypothetical protein DFQ12_4341 [Sphingobacterium detergens]